MLRRGGLPSVDVSDDANISYVGEGIVGRRGAEPAARKEASSRARGVPEKAVEPEHLQASYRSKCHDLYQGRPTRARIRTRIPFA